jgi:VanZ family protein
MSLTPQIELPFEFRGVDKVFHSLGYLWLAVIPFFGFERFKMALVGASLMFLLGIGLECIQGFVPGRFFSVADMIANGIGVVLGVFLGLYLKPRLWMHLQS